MSGLSSVGAVTSALEGAVAGDEVAFARIVATYHADLVRVAYGICGDEDAALDAVQAAWVIAWRKLRTVREPRRLRAWLVAVAANEARHVAGRRHGLHVIEIAVDPPAEDPDPSEEISRVDLVNVLGRLRPADRQLLALRYAAGLDSAEIAPILHVSPSGVRVRLMRLMARLRKELADG